MKTETDIHGDCLEHLFNGVRGWLTPNEADALAEEAKDAIVLEIGSFCGRSTIAMARTAKTIYALDWHFGDGIIGVGKDTLAEFWGNVCHAGYRGTVVPLVGRSQQLSSSLGESWVDVAFVDGGHDEDSAIIDMELAKRCLKPHGTIICHDWDRESVRNAFFKIFGFPIGAERQVNVTYIVKDIQKESRMSLTKEDLIAEQAGLDQQEKQCTDLIASTNLRIEAINGAKQMVAALLKKIGDNAMPVDRTKQLEAENAELRERIEIAEVGRESDALQIKQLSEEKASRNGNVPVQTGLESR